MVDNQLSFIACVIPKTTFDSAKQLKPLVM